jgi:hypothetical protein
MTITTYDSKFQHQDGFLNTDNFQFFVVLLINEAINS